MCMESIKASEVDVGYFLRPFAGFQLKTEIIL